MRMSSTIGAVLLLTALMTCLSPSVLHARWSSRQDNAPRSGLETMTDQKLFNEAFDVCVQRAFLEKPSANPAEGTAEAVADASAYLATITGVVAHRHDGQVPPWMAKLSAAHKVKECQAAFRAFLEAHTPPEERRRPTSRPRSLREELPPWLAPPAE
jgi:hypothetical protein